MTAAARGGAAAGLALAAALGAAQTLAFDHTAAWPLPLAACAVLAWLVARATPGRAAQLGLAYGTAWIACGTWWLYISMHHYGGLPAWMAALAVLALAAFLSLYLALALAAFARWRSGRALPDALLFAAGWLLAELARGVLFTGFPWLASGYAQVDAPLARLAPFVGVYGIGAAGAALSAWVAFGLTGVRESAAQRLAPAALAALLLAALGASPQAGFGQPTGTLNVTLLQGNVPQDEKFESTHQAAALEWHLGELLKAGGDLVVAPETSVPFLPEQMPEGVWAAIERRFTRSPTAALIGVPLGDERAGYTNSAAGFAAGQPAYRYDKQHLVPFGEFVPFGFRWFTQLMNIPLGDFERGPLAAPSFALRGERIGPNICYEDLFGEELAARFAVPAEAPTILANLSNIGWFGDSSAVAQHLQISRLRTLELERPMLRATNTGATAVIDHRAQVLARLEPHTRGVLISQVQGRSGITPFAWWAARFGLWPLGLAAAVVVAWMARHRAEARP